MRFFDELGKRKAEIVSAALKIADKCGIKGITTKRIAHEVGVVESSLYRHVSSKTEIFLMIIELAERLIAKTFKKLEGTPEEKLKELLLYIGDFLEDFPGIYRIIFSDELYTESPDLFEKFRSFTLSLAKRIESVLREGMREELFRKDLDLEVATFIFLGIIDTSFSLWNFIYERKQPLRELMRRFFNLYLISVKEVKA